MPDAFQQIADQIDLDGAVRKGLNRNDLLPPRFEDKVLGEVGARFSEGLKSRLEQGRYDPTPAQLVFVPKPGNTTRPAALMTLSDRVMYDAIVQALRPRIDTALLGPEIVFWPRGEKRKKRWVEFEQAPLMSDKLFIARADVAGFYESIDHDRLRQVLVDLTGRRLVVEALMEFLARVMGDHRGIPQGLDASDPIATAYLSTVDSAMIRTCSHYFRNGDDVRIAADTMENARGDLYAFEQELRKIGLLANNSKSVIDSRDHYKRQLDDLDLVHEQTREALIELRISEIEESDEDGRGPLLELLEREGLEELGWGLFYHGNVSLDEVIDVLRPLLSPTDITVAARVFEGAMTRGLEAGSGLSPEAFHQRIGSSLFRLAAARSSAAIHRIAELIRKFPEKTNIAAQYLLALVSQEPSLVIEQVSEILTEGGFRTAWEQAWLLRVLGSVAYQLDPEVCDLIRAHAEDEGQESLSRIEAVKVLGSVGRLDHAVVRRLWNTASVCFHPDLVVAAYRARTTNGWCEPFLEAAQVDQINAVVIKHLEDADRL